MISAVDNNLPDYGRKNAVAEVPPVAIGRSSENTSWAALR
jgi:hypothetical protein